MKTRRSALDASIEANNNSIAVGDGLAEGFTAVSLVVETTGGSVLANADDVNFLLDDVSRTFGISICIRRLLENALFKRVCGDSSLITLLHIFPSANLVYYSRTIV